MQGELLTRREVSEKLSLSIYTVDMWARKKIITPLTANEKCKTVRFAKAEIENLFTKKNKEHDRNTTVIGKNLQPLL